MRVAPKLEKDVLHDLLGVRGLLRNPQHQGIDGARVPVVETLQGPWLAADKLLHQRRVRRLFVIGHRFENRQKHGR